jgi:hypothetical protein
MTPPETPDCNRDVPASLAPAAGSVNGLIATIKAIKTTALETKNAQTGLAHIVRLCIDAEKATGTWIRIDQRQPSSPNDRGQEREH